MKLKRTSLSLLIMLIGLLVFDVKTPVVFASENGGGYALTNQIGHNGTTAKMYDATNGLPTSDANCILGSKTGYIWVGGYSGVLKFDGASFDRLDSSYGLTSARCLFEDSKGRVWVGTNDNGVACVIGRRRMQFITSDGLPSLCVRSFAEDSKGRIYVGTSSGLVYIDKNMEVVSVDNSSLNKGLIVKLSADTEGNVYGYSGSGFVFKITDGKIKEIFKGRNINIENISNILADPNNPGKVYYGTYSGYVYYGNFGADASALTKIEVNPVDDVHWLSYDCNRVWVCSRTTIGYLDENQKFNMVNDLPMNADIEMLTSDYQGNIWAASTTQGVMKIVASNFLNVLKDTDFEENVVYCTYIYDGYLYIGNEEGLLILDKDGKSYTNSLTEYIADARVRHIFADSKGNIWISTFENERGLVCQKSNGEIVSFTYDDGMNSNLVRCVIEASNGTIYVGTNNGINFIKNYQVVHPFDTEKELKDSVILSLLEHDDEIYVGTNGDGIYTISDRGIRHLGFDNGLTSDIIMRIKWDEKRGVYWTITSNSIQYIKNDIVVTVSSFPYNNCYDMYFEIDDDDIWVLASDGIYCVNSQDMINDEVTKYRHYNLLNGLPSMPTANAYSAIDSNGDMFVASRKGVCKFNIDNFVEENVSIKYDISTIICDKEEIYPDEAGRFIIPAGTTRVSFKPAILDFTESNPVIHMCLEGVDDEGITVPLSEIKPLEYTGLKYGEYRLHLQIMNNSGSDIIQEMYLDVEKKPLFFEMLLVQLIIIFLIAVGGGILVWRILSKTVISRQYIQLQEAKDEVERANSIKDRFIANISNFLRTPLITIMGMDEMILRRDPSISSNEYFFSVINDALDIKKAAESLLELIDSLLNISRIESGKISLVESEYDTVTSLRSAISIADNMCSDKGLSFDLEVDEKMPLRLYGDIDKISQITMTLLHNAVQYTSIGGVTLRVSVEEILDNDCYAAISVKDTGLGVPDELKDVIFNSMDNLGHTDSNVPYEFGLGLNLSMMYAQLMKGSIDCKSTFGEGAEFIFRFKQRIIDATPVGQFKDKDTKLAHGIYVPRFIAPDAEILIVDSSVTSIRIIKGLLKDTKMFIATANTGEECIEKIKFGNYNLVLLDNQLPDIPSDELLVRIREIKPDLPIYALSTVAFISEEAYLDKGYSGLILKPVDSDILEKTIIRHIPSNIYISLTGSDENLDENELPENMQWLRDISELDVDVGIRESGGAKKYISTLKVFMEALDVYASGIDDAYKNLDIKLFTIKIHSLKTSFAVVGAGGLEAMAEALEAAGNRNDVEYIADYIDRFLSQCRALYGKLANLR